MTLTPLAKLMITLIVITAVGLGIWTHRPQLHHDPDGAVASAGSAPGKKPRAKPRAGGRLVVGVGDFGGAYAGLVANDGATPGAGSRFKQRGLTVELRLLPDLKARLVAFERREIDLLLTTVDALANLEPSYHDKGVELRAFLLTAWSRGNLGIAAAPRVRSVEDLRGQRLATMRNGADHFFLLMMLRDSNLLPADIDRLRAGLVYATRPSFAVDMFRRGDVAAVAAAEPYLSQALGQGKGHLLISTATASNLIAEVLCARAELLDEREADMIAFTRAWLEGVAQLQREPQAAARHAQAAEKTAAEAQRVLSQLKLATFADNREFFGLEHEHALYVELFEDAEQLWQREGLIKRAVAPAGTRWVRALEALASEHTGEVVHEDFQFRRGPRKGARPLLTKSVSIYFGSGSAQLDDRARGVIDTFAEELDALGNTYVRVEGHTDSIGSRAKNVALSQQRAQAVVEDLVQRRGFDRRRFQALGLGSDRPKANNASDSGRGLNRRTDFLILPNE